jgi:hypothetical protein
MVRRSTNSFAAKLKRLPHKAFLRRSERLRQEDRDELEAVMRSIASGSEYLSYAGTRGAELYCTVVCFDSEEKAKAMQAWIDGSGIRPAPKVNTDFPQLKVGR